MPTQQQETIDYIAANGFDITTLIGLKTALKSADFQDFLIPHRARLMPASKVRSSPPGSYKGTC